MLELSIFHFMRLLLTLLLALPTMAFAQLCSEPSPVSYSGFGLQQTEADLSATENYLDALNTSTFSLDNSNRAIWADGLI